MSIAKTDYLIIVESAVLLLRARGNRNSMMGMSDDLLCKVGVKLMTPTGDFGVFRFVVESGGAVSKSAFYRFAAAYRLAIEDAIHQRRTSRKPHSQNRARRAMRDSRDIETRLTPP